MQPTATLPSGVSPAGTAGGISTTQQVANTGPATLTAQYPSTPNTTVKPTAVITSQPAQDNLNQIQTASDTANTNIQQQNQNNQQQQNNTETTPTTETDNTPNPQDQINDIIKSLVNEENTPVQPTDLQQSTTDEDNAQIEQDNANSEQVNNVINNINAGTYPLSASEQAQVQGVANSYRDAQTAAQNYANGLSASATQSTATSGLEQYSPQQSLGVMQRAVSEGGARINTINNRLTNAQTKLTQALIAGDLKSATALSTQINDDIKNRTTEIGNIQKAIEDEQTKMDSDAKANATLGLQAIMDNENIDYKTKTLQNQQTAQTEKQKVDNQNIIDDQAKNAIDAQKEQIAQATYNATYGQFVNPDGSINTNIDPTKVSGYTQLNNGLGVIDAQNLPKAMQNQSDIGGLKVLSHADVQNAQIVTSLLKNLAAIKNEIPSASGTGSEQYKNDVAQFNAQLKAVATKMSSLSGLSIGNTGIFRSGQNFDKITSQLNDSLTGLGLTPPPYGQVFQSPTDAQKYFTSTGQTAEYQNEVTKANTLAKSAFGRNANDGEIMQIINGQ